MIKRMTEYFPHFVFHVHDCHLSLIQAHNEIDLFSLTHFLCGSRHLYYNIKMCGLLFFKIVFIKYYLLVTCKDCNC